MAQQKKDLSDLKARLGLKKDDAQSAPPAPGAQPTAPGPSSSQAAPALQAPPGAQPQQAPPGVAPPAAAPVAVPPPDARRDPFAQAQAQIAMGAPANQAIVDAGPQIDIPIERKKPTGLIIGLAVTALLAAAVGYGFGGVMQSRKIYNMTVDDAQKIKGGIGDLAKVTKKVIDAVNNSRKRNKKKIVYDKDLIDALRAIQQSSPLANVDNAQKLEHKLFRTNYALMDDMLISRLFKYFNNSLRLFGTIDAFITHAEAKQKDIESFFAAAQKDTRNYGLYLGADKNHYYLGGLTQISAPTCPNKKPWKPEAKCQLGFLVSTEGTKWTWRPGKPDKKGRTKLSDIVIPIPPNDAVLAGLTGKPGQMSYSKYALLYRGITRTAALLSRDHKPLVQNLGTQASKPKVFAF